MENHPQKLLIDRIVKSTLRMNQKSTCPKTPTLLSPDLLEELRDSSIMDIDLDLCYRLLYHGGSDFSIVDDNLAASYHNGDHPDGDVNYIGCIDGNYEDDNYEIDENYNDDENYDDDETNDDANNENNKDEVEKVVGIYTYIY